MEFSELTEAQKAKIADCTSSEELFELAKDEGYELSDDDLSAISGGEDTWDCPRICNQ